MHKTIVFLTGLLTFDVGLVRPRRFPCLALVARRGRNCNYSVTKQLGNLDASSQKPGAPLLQLTGYYGSFSLKDSLSKGSLQLSYHIYAVAFSSNNDACLVRSMLGTCNCGVGVFQINTICMCDVGCVLHVVATSLCWRSITMPWNGGFSESSARRFAFRFRLHDVLTRRLALRGPNRHGFFHEHTPKAISRSLSIY